MIIKINNFQKLDNLNILKNRSKCFYGFPKNYL